MKLFVSIPVLQELFVRITVLHVYVRHHGRKYAANSHGMKSSDQGSFQGEGESLSFNFVIT